MTSPKMIIESFMFSKNIKSNPFPFNSPRPEQSITNQNALSSSPSPYLSFKPSSKPKNTNSYSAYHPLTSHPTNTSTLPHSASNPYLRPYDMLEDPSLSNISLNLDNSICSASTISNKKKMVSFDFDPIRQQYLPHLQPSLPSKSLLKSSLKLLPLQSSSNFLKPLPSPSNKAFGSTNSLLSLTSLKTGFSWLSGFAKNKNPYKPTPIDLELKKYKNQIETSEYKKELYTDNIFSCSSTSLAYRSEDERFREIQWVRLTEFYRNRKWVLYEKCIKNRGEVRVGRFECEGMIGAIDRLRWAEGFVEGLFENEEVGISGVGIYCLKVLVHGNQKVVIVDDYVPVVKEGEGLTPAFLRVEDKDTVEFWPFLLQKAYAKLFNTYQSLMETESIEDWMSTMIGHQVLVYNTNDEILKQIIRQESTEANYIFFKDSSHWIHTKLEPFIELQQQLSFTPTLPPSSTLSFPQLTSFYPKLLIFNQLLQNCTKIQSLKLPARPKPSFDTCIYKFSLPFSSNIDLSIWQKDMKYFRGIGYKYSAIRLMLVMAEPTGEGYRWIGSQYSETKVATLKNVLTKGEYYLILMINWFNKPFELNIKLTSEVIVQELTRVDNSLHDKILEQTASDIAQRFGICKQVTERVCIYKLIDKNLGIMMESIHNEHHRVVACVRKSYKVVGNSGGKLMALTKNVETGTLSWDIPPLKGIGTMVVARNRGDAYLLAEHK